MLHALVLYFLLLMTAEGGTVEPTGATWLRLWRRVLLDLAPEFVARPDQCASQLPRLLVTVSADVDRLGIAAVVDLALVERYAANVLYPNQRHTAITTQLRALGIN